MTKILREAVLVLGTLIFARVASFDLGIRRTILPKKILPFYKINLRSLNEEKVDK